MEKFGMHYVDFNDPKRPRTAKDSARYYAQVIKDNGFKKPPASMATRKTASVSIVLVCTAYLSWWL